MGRRYLLTRCGASDLWIFRTETWSAEKIYVDVQIMQIFATHEPQKQKKLICREKIAKAIRIIVQEVIHLWNKQQDKIFL